MKKGFHNRILITRKIYNTWRIRPSSARFLLHSFTWLTRMSKKQDIIFDNGWEELLSHTEKRSPQRNSSAFCVFRGIFQLNCLPTQTKIFYIKFCQGSLTSKPLIFLGAPFKFFKPLRRHSQVPMKMFKEKVYSLFRHIG